MLFDDPARLRTSEILNWHAFCLNGINAQRVETLKYLRTGQPMPQQLENCLGIGATENDIEQYCNNSCVEVDISTVLVLTAHAEFHIRRDLERRLPINSPDFLSGRLKLLAQRFTPLWRIPLYDGGILDAWKGFIRQQYPRREDQDRLVRRIGDFHNILLFRHWIAHGRGWQPTQGPSSFLPSEVAKIIDQLYKTLSDVSSDGKVMRFTYP